MDMGKFFVEGLVLIFIVSLLAVGVWASFDYSSNEIINSYSAGETIKGKFNISFDSQRTDSLLTSNFEGNITLLDFLEANGLSETNDYSCNFAGCSDNYAVGNSLGESGSIPLSPDGNVVGFRINGGNILSVSSVNFTIAGGIPESCQQQILIDTLDDNDYTITSGDYLAEDECTDAPYTGCFEVGEELTPAIVGASNYYCGKITMPLAPAYKLKTRIKNNTDYDEPIIEMSLWSANEGNAGDLYGKCMLPIHTQEGFEQLGCIVNYSSAVQQDYFVCIRKIDDIGEFEIRTETHEPCGGSDINFGEDPNRDYDVWGKRMKFAEMQTLEVNDAVFEERFSELLSYQISEYISEKYGGSCLENCAIPIRFRGQEGTSAEFGNLEIMYSDSGSILKSHEFYEMDFSSAQISSDELSLDLTHANFEIPLGSEEETEFKLYLDGDLIFEEEINITESFEFDISPTSGSFGGDITFTADIDANITSSTWDFGDGSPTKTVNGKSVTHRYTEQEVFTLEVELLREDGVSAKKSFSIVIGDAKELANSTILKYKKRLENLEPEIEAYPSWINVEIKRMIDLDSLSTSLGVLEKNYNESVSDEDYQTVMLELIGLKIPKNIAITKSGPDLPLVAGHENINLNYIEELSGKSSDDFSELGKTIIGWMNAFYDSVISFEQISAVYDGDSDVLISKFKIETLPIMKLKDPDERDYNPFLILGYDIENNGKFKSDHLQKTIGSGTYISLKSGKENEIFEFAVFTEYEAENFGAYISPKIDRLGIIVLSTCGDGVCSSEENKTDCPADCKTRKGWSLIWMSVLLFLALITYIAMQEWYKKYYEKSLFGNKNDLYNVVTFVYNSRKSELTNSDIRIKLQSVGWSGEKITYIMRKIDGHRTGMFEIPIFKMFENRKVKKEIEKRQGGAPVDTRFIKQPKL